MYHKLSDYPKALNYYERALLIEKKVLSENDSDLATTYAFLGSVCDSMEDYTKALEYFQKELEISKITLPENHLSLPLRMTMSDWCTGIWVITRKHWNTTRVGFFVQQHRFRISKGT